MNFNVKEMQYQYQQHQIAVHALATELNCEQIEPVPGCEDAVQINDLIEIKTATDPDHHLAFIVKIADDKICEIEYEDGSTTLINKNDLCACGSMTRLPLFIISHIEKLGGNIISTTADYDSKFRVFSYYLYNDEKYYEIVKQQCYQTLLQKNYVQNITSKLEIETMAQIYDVPVNVYFGIEEARDTKKLLYTSYNSSSKNVNKLLLILYNGFYQIINFASPPNTLKGKKSEHKSTPNTNQRRTRPKKRKLLQSPEPAPKKRKLLQSPEPPKRPREKFGAKKGDDWTNCIKKSVNILRKVHVSNEDEISSLYWKQSETIDSTMKIVLIHGICFKIKWVNLILNGEKCWEIQPNNINSNYFNKNLLILNDGLIHGVLQINNSFATDYHVLLSSFATKNHCIRNWALEMDSVYNRPHVWVINKVQKFTNPIPYIRKHGVVTRQNVATYQGYILQSVDDCKNTAGIKLSSETLENVQIIEHKQETLNINQLKTNVITKIYNKGDKIEFKQNSQWYDGTIMDTFHNNMLLIKTKKILRFVCINNIKKSAVRAVNNKYAVINKWYDNFKYVCNEYQINNADTIINVINQTVTKPKKIAWIVSYLIACFERNNSVIATINNYSQKKIKKLLQNLLLKKKKLHNGVKYKINNYTINTWYENVKKCVRKHDFLMMSKQMESDGSNCPCCNKFVRVGSNPYLICSQCDNNYHLHCLPLNLLNYKAPITQDPDSTNYERTYNYEKCKIKCHQCTAVLIKQKIDEYNTDYNYVGKIKSYHYLSKIIKSKNNKLCKIQYYKCTKNKLNMWYLSICNWFNDDKFLNSMYINWDKWNIINKNDINIDIYNQSALVFKQILQLANNQYKTYYSALIKNYGSDLIQKYENFQPYVCEPEYYKSTKRIGSKIVTELFNEPEMHLIKYFAANEVCETIKYKSSTKLTIDSIKPLTEIGKHKEIINKHFQQYDFAGKWLRCKLYFGAAHYTNPAIGNGPFKGNANDKVLASKMKAVLCKIPQPAYYPKIMMLINRFINLRYKCINIKWVNETNQFQINSYAAGGRIMTHFDNQSWFKYILLMKIFNHSGLHLSCHGQHGHPINPWLYHPLIEGSVIELNQWSFTYYTHCRFSWMSAPGGSITGILRDIIEKPLFHKYPDLFNTKNVFVAAGKLQIDDDNNNDDDEKTL